MPKEKNKKNSWGGSRKGAGRPEGTTKAKICISVNESNWNTAVKRWKKKPSWLVDTLVSDYLNAGQAVLEMGAAK